jgi:uncharacterized membrane protein
MTTQGTSPLTLYVATYHLEDPARDDWDALKKLAKHHPDEVEGLIVINRQPNGKIVTYDNFHTAGEARKGARWGAVGGAIVGLIFPPALLAGALVGAGVGLGVGALVQPGDKGEIKADVEDALPLGSFGIVALLDSPRDADVNNLLTRAAHIATYLVDRANASAIAEGARTTAQPAAD